MKYINLFPLILSGLIIGLSSCKKDSDPKAVITVLATEVDAVSGNSVQVPAGRASVKFYSTRMGAEHIETTVLTDAQGKAEFEWFEEVILDFDVTHEDCEFTGHIILEKGKTVEKTVICD